MQFFFSSSRLVNTSSQECFETLAQLVFTVNTTSQRDRNTESLASDIRASSSLSAFGQRLKTFLFHQSFPLITLSLRGLCNSFRYFSHSKILWFTLTLTYMLPGFIKASSSSIIASATFWSSADDFFASSSSILYTHQSVELVSNKIWPTTMLHSSLKTDSFHHHYHRLLHQ